jgi:hypothetical protein
MMTDDGLWLKFYGFKVTACQDFNKPEQSRRRAPPIQRAHLGWLLALQASY